jgi:hypothetical protein
MLDERIGLYASVDLAFSRGSSLRNSFSQPESSPEIAEDCLGTARETTTGAGFAYRTGK